MARRQRPISVYMMDLVATVPYYTAYLSRALLDEGVDVRIGSITYYLDVQCFRLRGLKLDPGCVDIVGRFATLPRAIRRVAKLAETLLNLAVLTVRFLLAPPDILHVQYLPMLRSRLPLDLWFARCVQWRGARMVLTVHDVLPHDTADRFREKFATLYSRADELICHSEHIRSRLVTEFQVPAEHVHVIPHGPFFFDLPPDDDGAVRKAYRLPVDAPIVLWQGIIFPYKGLDLLLSAWQQVQRDHSTAVLMVVGTGSAQLLEQVRLQVQQLGLERVHLDLRFTSAEELAALYRAAAVVVYPYRAITTSGALATGLALGKAIVVSDLPVFREQLTHGEDAVIVPAADVDALSHGIVSLLNDTALQERLRTAVRKKDFGAQSWRVIAEQTRSVYELAVARKRLRPAVVPGASADSAKPLKTV